MRARAVTARSMQAFDRQAIEHFSIPSLLLMENAGRNVAEEVLRRAARSRKRARVAVFCGKGNNGGDGMVCARHLFFKGVSVRVFLLAGKSMLNGDPLLQFVMLKKLGIKICCVRNAGQLARAWKKYSADIVIDAIFGIGFKGEAQGVGAAAIDLINSKAAYVFAIDIPSGLDATTGRASGPCVNADETVTLGFPKTGLYKASGLFFSGKIKVADIGLPPVSLLKRRSLCKR